jgi:hypothetical protein
MAFALCLDCHEDAGNGDEDNFFQQRACRLQAWLNATPSFPLLQACANRTHDRRASPFTDQLQSLLRVHYRTNHGFLVRDKFNGPVRGIGKHSTNLFLLHPQPLIRFIIFIFIFIFVFVFVCITAAAAGTSTPTTAASTILSTSNDKRPTPEPAKKPLLFLPA